MKAIVCLTLLTAATLQAQPYSTGGSEFDSGRATLQVGSVMHAGVLTSWLRAPSHSANYSNQPGYVPIPLAVPTLGAPTLSIALVGHSVRVSWPSSAAGFVLQEKSALTGGSWEDVLGPYSASVTEQYLLIPADQAGQFYRLRSP